MRTDKNQQSQVLAPEQRALGVRPRRKRGPTIRDVALECGVSAMSVSAVLNNRHGEVSPQTREKILCTISRLNYQPSAAARALSRKRTETIGIVLGIVGAVESLTNAYTAGVLSGVLAAAKLHGYDVNIVTRDWINSEQSTSYFNDERTDGTLVIAPKRDSDIVTALSSLGSPLVTISGERTNRSVLNVDMDDMQVAQLAMSHLAGLGHRRIAHITGDRDLVSAEYRELGYRSALAQYGCEACDDYLVHAGYNATGASERVRDLMNLPKPPTAIFCGNDNIAFVAISTLHALGKKVPGDVSIVGVDDLSAAALVTPSLTTIRQPLKDIGFLAGELLIDSIDGAPSVSESRLVPAELIIRSSTSSPPS